MHGVMCTCVAEPPKKVIIVTYSLYWFKRYCVARGIKQSDAIYVNSSYSTQGLPRGTPVILTTFYKQVRQVDLNRIKERFDNVRVDEL